MKERISKMGGKEGRKDGGRERAEGKKKTPGSALMAPFFLSGCRLDALTDPQQGRLIDGHTVALLIYKSK